MADRFFFSLAAVAAIGMIALSLVWPKGQSVDPAPPAAEAAKPR